jgi:hypothetical protein
MVYVSNGDSAYLHHFGDGFRADEHIFPELLLVCGARAVVVAHGPAPAGDPGHGLVEVGGVRVQVLFGRSDVPVAQERLEISERGTVVERLRGQGVDPALQPAHPAGPAADLALHDPGVRWTVFRTHHAEFSHSSPNS